MIGEGLRHAAASPAIRTIMLRAFTFTLTGAAAWALMPLVSADLLDQGAAVYGLLLGALGLGAVIGATTSTWFRARFSAEAIIRAAALIYGVALRGRVARARPRRNAARCWSSPAPAGSRRLSGFSVRASCGRRASWSGGSPRWSAA